MPPDSDVEDYTEVDDMEEVQLTDDLPPEDDEDDVIEGVEDINIVDDDADDADIIDQAKVIFEMHEASVFAIDVAKNNSCLVVTGGEDDRAYVWNYETAQCLFECTGHTDSVVCCSFSADGKYVMSADMAGNVRVFASVGGQCVWEYECEELEWCQWHRSANVLFAGTSGGDVYMWMVPIGACKIYASHGSKTTCARVTSTGKEIVVGYEDGSMKKWDLKSVSSLFHHKPTGNDNVEGGIAYSVLCLDLLNDDVKNNNLAVFGTESGTVTLLNSHTGKQLCSFTLVNKCTNGSIKTTENQNEEDTEEGQELEGESHAVESVIFSPCGCYVAAGSVNGTLCIWDISLQRVRHTCTSPAGLTKLIWTGIEASIISSCLDGVIRLWDHKKGEVVKEITGHVGNILDIIITPDGRHLLTAGDDCTARIFEK